MIDRKSNKILTNTVLSNGSLGFKIYKKLNFASIYEYVQRGVAIKYI